MRGELPEAASVIEAAAGSFDSGVRPRSGWQSQSGRSPSLRRQFITGRRGDYRRELPTWKLQLKEKRTRTPGACGTL